MESIQISEDIYKILSFEDYDPETETWEFKPGSIVKASFLKNEKGAEFLVAIKEVDTDDFDRRLK